MLHPLSVPDCVHCAGNHICLPYISHPSSLPPSNHKVRVKLLLPIYLPRLLFRSVADEQRSFALGVQSVMFRVFGSIPGPLLFGYIIDSGCVYSQEECGRIANCWVYDNNLLSVRAFIFCILGVGACLVCTILSWVFYPPVGFKLAPPDGTEDENSSNEKIERVEEAVEGAVTIPNPVFQSDD